jgi:ribosomal protein L37AE/L43A
MELEKKARLSPVCPVCGEEKASGEHSQIVCWGKCWRDEKTGLKYTQLDTEEWLKVYAPNFN